MSNIIGVGWTDTRVDALRQLVADGWTATEISQQLGVGRGAVIGKITRMGLQLTGAYTPAKPPSPRHAGIKPAKPSVERRAPLSPRRLKPANGRVRIHTGGGAAFRGQVEVIQDVEITDLPPDQSEFACTIAELADDMCRWPLGDPSADMRYCGAPSVGPWCPRHRCIVFNKPEKRGR